MQIQRRVTLRCLVDDLTEDWRDGSQQRAVTALRAQAVEVVAARAKDSSLGRAIRSLPPVNKLAHPLIEHFENEFSQQGDHQKQNIGSLAEPHWWKQKTGRWRGAASDHAKVGMGAWLCAGGRRTADSPDDFYAVFKSNVVSYGASGYLPAPEDAALSRVEEKIHLQDAWRLQVQMTVNILLADAAAHLETFIGPVEVTVPSISARNEPLAQLSVALEKTVVGNHVMYECILIIEPAANANAPFLGQLAEAARAAIQDDPAEWRTTVYGVDGRGQSHEAVLDESHLQHARGIKARGHVEEHAAPKRLTLGLHAHYSPRERLTDATVDGSAVEAICGYWFVPTADHEGKFVCAECQEGMDRLHS